MNESNKVRDLIFQLMLLSKEDQERVVTLQGCDCLGTWNGKFSRDADEQGAYLVLVRDGR